MNRMKKIAGGLMVATLLGYGYYILPMQSGRANVSAQHLVVLAGGMRNLAQSERDFSKIDVKRMAAEKALPEDMRYDAKTGRLFNEWNGEVALGSWGKDIAKFAIEFKGVPKKECAKLIMAFSALEGSDFERVEVNGKMVPKFKRADLPEEGLAHCGLEKGNDMVMIGR